MNDITFWPFADKNGIKVLTGSDRVKSEIITIMLLQKGENPAIPEIGLAPDLFSTISESDIKYFCYEMQKEIINRIKDIKQIRIYPNPENNDINSVNINIEFQTKEEIVDSFSFVWSEYISLLRNENNNFVTSLRRTF